MSEKSKREFPTLCPTAQNDIFSFLVLSDQPLKPKDMQLTKV